MDKKGASAIELLVLFVCLIIVAAIVIVLKIRAQPAANEKSALASLKLIREVESIFRSRDYDRNGINDYWTGDVSGLYRLLNSDGLQIKGIDLDLAEADTDPIAPIANYVGSALGHAMPKDGYYFTAMTTDETGSIYRINPLRGTNIYALHNSKFAFCAYPEIYEETGKNIFMVSHDGTIWRKDIGSATSVRTWTDSNPKGFWKDHID